MQTMDNNFDVTTLHGRRATRRWERTSVGDLLERLTWSTPDKEALVGVAGAFSDETFARLTYRQADTLANQFAHALIARGLGQGDIVMMFCENSVESFLVKIGAAKAGVVIAPINPAMAPDMVAAMIDLVDAKAAIVDAEVWPKVATAVTERELMVAATITIGGGAVAGSPSFADFIAGQPTTEPDVEIHGDDVWEILFTSGTTALPKAVMITHSGTYLAAYGFALSLTRGLRFESELKTGTFLPLVYHVGDQPFAYSNFLSGGTLVVGRRPDPVKIAEMVDSESITALWSGAPAMVTALDAALTERSDLNAHSLSVIVYGWAALHPKVLASMKNHTREDLVVFEIFGQTESISCHRFWPDKWPDLYAATAPQDNYVGFPSPILASKVIDAEGNDLIDQPGVAGEAVYRSPAVMAGYYRNEPATREAFTFGWFHSGDSCAYDENGFRVMIDRYKDIIKSGGENVSSQRVEAILNLHPGVTKAVVIAIPHDHWGEAVAAIVIRATGDATSEEALIAYSRGALAGYETPKTVIFVDELPETIGGKVLKYKLRTTYANHFADVIASQ
jgi:acyl-CoA synthetase (AMP-forming)/AMP-acid ligase II